MEDEDIEPNSYIGTADPVCMGRNLSLYTMLEYSILARRSAHIDWISCMNLAQYPRLPFCVQFYIQLIILLTALYIFIAGLFVSTMQTADPVGICRKSRQYIKYVCILQYSVQAGLSVHTNWISCAYVQYLPQFLRLPFWVLINIDLLR